MKKIFLMLVTTLALTACSSDDPIADNGSTGGNSITNPAKRNSIPADQLTGKWVFDTKSYTIEAGDDATYKKIENDLLYGTSDDAYPRRGFFKFYPEQPEWNISKMYAEGSVRWNYVKDSDDIEPFGDYFSSNDTIYYYHWTLKNKYDYMVKKGDRLYYHFENTGRFKGEYPDGDVKKVIYYAEYVRIKE